MFSEGFSQRLRSRMSRLGVQANELAEKLEVTPGAVSNWMNGTNEAKGKNLRSLAEALRCDPHWLLTGETGEKSSVMALHETPQSGYQVEVERWQTRAEAAEKRLAQLQAGLRVLLAIGSDTPPAGFNSTFLAKAEEIADAIENLADQNLREDSKPEVPKPSPPPDASTCSNKPNVP